MRIPTDCGLGSLQRSRDCQIRFSVSFNSSNSPRASTLIRRSFLRLTSIPRIASRRNMVYVPLGSATGSMYHGVAMGDHEAFSYATYDRPTYDRLAPVQRLPRISSWIGNDSSNSPWIGNEEFEWRSRKFEVQSKRLPPSPEKAVAAARTLPA